MVGRNTAPLEFDVDRIEEKLSNLQDSVLKQKGPEKAKNQISDTANITDIQSSPDTLDEPEQSIVYDNIIDQLKDKGNPPKIYEQYVPPVFTPKYSKSPPPKQKPTPTNKVSAPETKKQAEKSEPSAKSKPVAVLKPEIRSSVSKTSAPVIKPEPMAPKKTVPMNEPGTAKVRETETTSQVFAIQVASLKDPAKAKILMNKFREKGYPAFCQESEVNDTTWHRVRIGPYPERALADKDQNRLKTAGVDSLIISTH